MNLKSIYNLYAQHPEGSWVTHPENARELHRFVKEHDVKNILELGTGIGLSTAVMAYALHEKGEGGMIHTVEQTEKCYKLAQELLPEELKPYVTFHKSDVKIWQTDYIPYQYFSIFETLPDVDFDFVLVDGSGPFVVSSDDDGYKQWQKTCLQQGVVQEKPRKGEDVSGTSEGEQKKVDQGEPRKDEDILRTSQEESKVVGGEESREN